jgi:hypothetical protein
MSARQMNITKRRLYYEGYWHDGAFVDLDIYEKDGPTIIVATDRSEEHQNTSITNRVQRIMYLAWVKAGKPMNVIFIVIEHYERAPVEYDRVTFKEFPATESCRMSGKDVGPEFKDPTWKRMTLGDAERLLLVA